jgi:hypothetical protein
MWGIYSDNHGGVDIGGTRDNLRNLGAQLINGYSGYIALDEAPPEYLTEGWLALDKLQLVPIDSAAEPILLRREGQVAVISGSRDLLAQIVGRTLCDLADEPYRMTPGSVPTHAHLEPADGLPYSSESTIGIVFHLAPEDDANFAKPS